MRKREGDANAPKEVWLSRAAGGRGRESDVLFDWASPLLYSFLPSIQSSVVQFGNIQRLPMLDSWYQSIEVQ